MGLFDAIEQLATGMAPITPVGGLKKSQDSPPKSGEFDPPRSKNTPGRQEGSKRTQSKHPAPQPKPERLTFLHPCPICYGRLFVAGRGGGFFCTTCQPGIEGQPVEAAGRMSKRTQADCELVPVNYDLPEALQGDKKPDPVTDQQRKYFRAAWPWIKENKAQLLAAGWTMAALVGRSKFRWPYGQWGLAWLPVWTREQVLVTINDKGAIAFTFRYCEKTITQTAKP